MKAMKKISARLLLLGFGLALAGCGRAPRALVPVSASFAGRDPAIRWNPSGALDVVYVEDRQAGPAVVYRRLGDGPAGPFTVSAPEPETSARKEAPPTLERLPDGGLLVAYPVALPGRWQGEILTRRSADGGKTWEAPLRLHPKSDGAHSFVSSAATPAGVVFAWLDKSSGRMGLQSAFTSDGRTFSPSSLDVETCQCCGTALLAGTADKQGDGIWLAYRDLEPGDLRDFKVLRGSAKPPVFSAAARLSSDGWHIQGCPEMGARLAQAGDGTLWAAWFTGGGTPGVYVTSSSDGGARFAPRTLMSDPSDPGWHPEIGVLPDGRILVLYEGKDAEDGLSVFGRIRDDGGTWGPPVRLLANAAYPRFASRGGRAALAATCRETKRVVVQEWTGDLSKGAGVNLCTAGAS